MLRAQLDLFFDVLRKIVLQKENRFASSVSIHRALNFTIAPPTYGFPVYDFVLFVSSNSSLVGLVLASLDDHDFVFAIYFLELQSNLARPG